MRQPGDEIRALTTLVDITSYAIADVGSIPTVSIDFKTVEPRSERTGVLSFRGRQTPF